MANNHIEFQYGAGVIWQVSGKRSLYSVNGIKKKKQSHRCTHRHTHRCTDTHKRNYRALSLSVSKNKLQGHQGLKCQCYLKGNISEYIWSLGIGKDFLRCRVENTKKKVDKHDRIKVNNIFMKDILKKVKRQLQTGRRYLKKIVLRMSIKNMKNSNKSVNNNKKDK